MFNFYKEDVILNLLLIFYFFGLMVIILLLFCEGIKMVSVVDLIDGVEVGKMCVRYNVSILFGILIFFCLYMCNKKFYLLML